MVSVLEDRVLGEPELAASVTPLGWPAVAAAGSLAAGAIHAAAIGVHSEHRSAVVAFSVVAVVQLGIGALLLARPTRRLLVGAVLANGALIAGWFLAKTRGIWFVEGLDVKEPVQFADGLAAGLALVAVMTAVVAMRRFGRLRVGGPRSVLGPLAVLLALLAVPGMVSAGSHAHAGGHDSVVTSGASHHDAAEPASAVPARPYDPALPIDLGGVDGVTPQEQARAENLVAITVLRLPQFADPAFAESMGFVSIGDGALGHEHYLSAANMSDDRILDPDYPESLVYDTTVTPKRLAAAMFMLDPGDTLADAPELGGKLTQWHIHDNLCFRGARVAGITDASGQCAIGLTKGVETPMIHVWIEPHPCGPFAALEGVAGGSIAGGEERLCDHAHGA